MLKAHLPDDFIESSSPKVSAVSSKAISNQADTILASITDQTNPIEGAGRLSLAMLFGKIANKELTDEQEFSILKTLADKKTPAPVQQIEQHTVMDMRVLLSEAVEENSAKMQESLDQAIAVRDAIQDRLGLTRTLQLPAAELKEDMTSEAGRIPVSSADQKVVAENSDIESDWTPGSEPNELSKLRRG